MQRPTPAGDHEETWIYPASYGQHLREWELPGLTNAERQRRRRAHALAKHTEAEAARAQADAVEQYPSYGSGSIYAVSAGLPSLGRRR